MIPPSWLERSGASADELAEWKGKGILLRAEIHGGAEFYYFSWQTRPVKFRDMSELIAKARNTK